MLLIPKKPLKQLTNFMDYSILLADDHAIVRSGIKALIAEHFLFSRIDEAGNENEIVEKIRSHTYDIILLDINMPDSDFIKMMSWLKATSPKTSILVFTMHAEDIYGERCLQLGAKGFLRKTASNDEIINAIQKVLNGKQYINENLEALISRRNKNKSITNPFYHLSSRELEIAMLLNKGISLPEICTVLNIQYSTANTYKRRIFEKLSVYNVLSLSRLMQSFNIEVQ